MVNLRKNKGITLIALVITIIVMLILVAVTISMAVNGGLFEYASKATKETQSEINKEKKIFDFESEILGSGMSTNDLIEYFTTEQDIHSWTRTGDTFTCSHCKKSYTMGDVVDYSPTTATTVTVSGQDSGVSDGITAGKLTAGDFGTGGSQTLSQEPSQDKLTWIIFGLDENGSLLITTQTPTVGNLTLYGKKAYRNGPGIMNNVCEKLYSNSTYGKARSMTIEDVNKALNWEDTRGMDEYDLVSYYRVEKGTKFEDIGNNWNIMVQQNYLQTPEEGKALKDYEVDGYFYYTKNNYFVDMTSDLINGPNLTNKKITETEKMVVLGDNGSWKNYWLATRKASVTREHDECSYATFGPGYVNNGAVDLRRSFLWV